MKKEEFLAMSLSYGLKGEDLKIKSMEKFKEFRGTKGEWEVEGDMICSDAKVAGNVVCVEPEDYLPDSRVNWKANAKLIAAAPNLLQALQELYYLVTELPEEGSIIEALANAKAAIEKAL